MIKKELGITAAADTTNVTEFGSPVHLPIFTTMTLKSVATQRSCVTVALIVTAVFNRNG
jgi:hypothetical protein